MTQLVYNEEIEQNDFHTTQNFAMAKNIIENFMFKYRNETFNFVIFLKLNLLIFRIYIILI